MVAINTAYSPSFFQNRLYNSGAFQQVDNRNVHAAGSPGQAHFQRPDAPAFRNDMRDYQAGTTPQIGFKTLVEHALGPVAQNLAQNLKTQVGQGLNIASSVLNNFARFAEGNNAAATTSNNANTSKNEIDETDHTAANPFSAAVPAEFKQQFPLPFPLTPLSRSADKLDDRLNQLFPGGDGASNAIKSSARELSRVAPESPEAMALQAKISGLAQANPQHKAAVPTLIKEVQQSQLDNILGSLQTILENIDPGSPAAQGVQARMNAIEKQKSNLS